MPAHFPPADNSETEENDMSTTHWPAMPTPAAVRMADEINRLRRMPEAEYQRERARMAGAPATFTYSPWRHGGWYVNNVRYPSGAVGCVSRNYPDKKWRIACDPRPFEQRPTFKCRDDAARAEWLAIATGLFANIRAGYAAKRAAMAEPTP